MTDHMRKLCNEAGQPCDVRSQQQDQQRTTHFNANGVFPMHCGSCGAIFRSVTVIQLDRPGLVKLVKTDPAQVQFGRTQYQAVRAKEYALSIETQKTGGLASWLPPLAAS